MADVLGDATFNLGIAIASVLNGDLAPGAVVALGVALSPVPIGNVEMAGDLSLDPHFKVTFPSFINTEHHGDAPLDVQVDFSASLVVVPRAVSTLRLSNGRIRLSFGVGMVRDNRLIDTDNYMISASTTGAAVRVEEIHPQYMVDYPSYVDVEISDQTIGEVYKLSVNPVDGPVSRWGDNVDGTTVDFTGESTAPGVKSLRAIGPNLVEVTFTKSMSNNYDILDSTRYTFTGGLAVVAVVSHEADKVVLATSTQTAGTSYDLTIT